MNEKIILGIDCGGTHTDAALLRVNAESGTASLLAAAKTDTLHDDLPASVSEAVGLLKTSGAGPLLAKIERATLGTTLEINALVQGRADKVGLALTAGPGLDPAHFGLGDHVCIVPGGLDHRGTEVKTLYTAELGRQSAGWPADGVRAVACVGKFSPRNPAHEEKMAQICQQSCGLPVTLGHTLSGSLNFPRRIATAYYNASVQRIHENFLNSVQKAFDNMGITARCRLLKADGGAIPFAMSRRQPVQSILSGPAASVMGAMAMWNPGDECALLMDMGGTTTDMAMFYKGSPVIDRNGMEINGRRTLVRSLASVSIGIGGDSMLHIEDVQGKKELEVGPMRNGPAMAFGGDEPTLLDSLNVLDAAPDSSDRGDVRASHRGIMALSRELGLPESSYKDAASRAIGYAMTKIARAAYDLVESVNSGPVYTLAALKAASEARPTKVCLVGGPARCVKERLSLALGLPVEISAHADVANAIGAALALPTDSLEIYVDTGKGELMAPALNYRQTVSSSYSLEQARARCLELLKTRLQDEKMEDAATEITEADLFATLDDYGRGARDMRICAQARPGILARLAD